MVLRGPKEFCLYSLGFHMTNFGDNFLFKSISLKAVVLLKSIWESCQFYGLRIIYRCAALNLTVLFIWSICFFFFFFELFFEVLGARYL